MWERRNDNLCCMDMNMIWHGTGTVMWTLLILLVYIVFGVSESWSIQIWHGHSTILLYDANFEVCAFIDGGHIELSEGSIYVTLEKKTAPRGWTTLYLDNCAKFIHKFKSVRFLMHGYKLIVGYLHYDGMKNLFPCCIFVVDIVLY